MTGERHDARGFRRRRRVWRAERRIARAFAGAGKTLLSAAMYGARFHRQPVIIMDEREPA